MEKGTDGFWLKLLRLFKLETMTTAGRFNLGALVVLTAFIGFYTASDKVCYIVSAIRDAYKTTILQENIADPYASVSVFRLIIPIAILIVSCFYFLYIDDKKKQEMDKEKQVKK